MKVLEKFHVGDKIPRNAELHREDTKRNESTLYKRVMRQSKSVIFDFDIDFMTFH